MRNRLLFAEEFPIFQPSPSNKGAIMEPTVKELAQELQKVFDVETINAFPLTPDYPQAFESEKKSLIQIEGIGVVSPTGAALHVQRFARRLLAASYYCKYHAISKWEIRAIGAYWRALQKWQDQVQAKSNGRLTGFDGGPHPTPFSPEDR
jgi:hypothetical protein